MTRFDALMAEGIYNVLYNGGLADIVKTTAPFYDARILAQQARAMQPTATAPTAGVFVAQTVGFLAQSLSFEELKEYRYMLTMQDVERASVPFPDTITIEYPEVEFFRTITETRKKYEYEDLVDRDEKTLAIMKKLDEPVDMPFQNETPLEEVIQYVKTATETPELPQGIPIYVDPIGLQEAERTMTSPVTLNLAGVKLKKSLKLMLKQLGLTYTVKDGLLTITAEDSEDQPTEIRVYPVADLSIIPFSLMGGGGMGGMGGGMGGGMMGGGMGGMGGGMGGMGGGMGGMGGGMDGWYGWRHGRIPLHADRAPGPELRPRPRLCGKKKQLRGLSRFPSAPSSSTFPRGRSAPSATGSEAIPGRVLSPRAVSRPQTQPGQLAPKTPRNQVSLVVRPESAEPFAFWDQHFQTKQSSAGDLLVHLYYLRKRDSYVDIQAAIRAFLKYRAKDPDPWLYEMLAAAIEMNKGRDTDVKQALNYAADQAVKKRKPTDLTRVADELYMHEMNDRAGQLLDLAAELDPAYPLPLLMSINLATATNDPQRMGNAVERLFALGWPDVDEVWRTEARRLVEDMVKVLQEDGRETEAQTLLDRLKAAEPRDLFLRLTWLGDADLDLIVEEPLGATAKVLTPRTVFGGAIVKNGYGKHPEEIYVCPLGFDGAYKVRLGEIYNNAKDPARNITLEIITHEGTPQEHKETRTLSLKDKEPTVVTLKDGRRKTVLPYQGPLRPSPDETDERAAEPAESPSSPGLIRPGDAAEALKAPIRTP